ncbi:hypothetical protein [Humidisolicoccus flavus]|uniref:hypothetical protein n=1 Tax=Humidisolicoccus flavus TaxID=3111414 RepID=UPI00324326FC
MTFAAFIVLAGVSVLVLVDSPHVTAFTTTIFALLGLAIPASVSIYGLKQTNELLDTIETNTNGSLHRRDNLNTGLQAENAQLRAELAAATGTAVTTLDTPLPPIQVVPAKE